MNSGLRLDLHVHSRYSPDSRLTLEQLVGRLPYTGIRGFALTDHNSVGGIAELAELRRAYPTYVFLPGVEVSTVEGHLLAYGVSEAPPARKPVLETIEWVRAHGGKRCWPIRTDGTMGWAGGSPRPPRSGRSSAGTATTRRWRTPRPRWLRPVGSWA